MAVALQAARLICRFPLDPCVDHVSFCAAKHARTHAQQADGSYKEAAAAYEAAHDYLSVIRLNLEHLRNPDEAVRVVKVRSEQA